MTGGMREITAEVVANFPVAEGIFQMNFRADEPVPGLSAGKFVNISLDRPDLLLKRPFGLFDYSEDGRSFSVCYQVVGKGTAFMREWQEGRKVTLTGPLGNGFALQPNMKKVALIGGGVGVFPLHSLIRSYPDREYAAFLGYRNRAAVCHKAAFERFARTHISTDDGSVGERGNAVDLYLSRRKEFDADVILACGPTVMLRALKEKFRECGVDTPTYISAEERMGCGVGACLVCVCGKKGENGETEKARVCKDGPVFRLEEVEL